MYNVAALYTITAIAVIVFSLILWWCLREIVRLHKRLDNLVDRLQEWQPADMKKQGSIGNGELLIKLKPFEHVRDRNLTT